MCVGLKPKVNYTEIAELEEEQTLLPSSNFQGNQGGNLTNTQERTQKEHLNH
ncbi:MAG: hypothetical protein K0R55_3249 [Sporomusa sp.]|jgi:hypothetical protein|nr:hypothetical protein [Sporomusa sp.]